ncbi:hypothetical protein K7432_002896 [Basidiobolus ranarum]|uniref:Uncharacterized protein n=1 Tax=Basidiobolus ranarum TaxID=34480 RepID=A0ABR2W808_9FUNG
MNSKTISQCVLPTSYPKDVNFDTVIGDYEYFEPEYVLSGLVEQVNNIHDINQLKQMVIEKEKELHLAATLGFSIARKNEDLEQKIRHFSQTNPSDAHELEAEKLLLLNKLSEKQEISHKLYESEDTVKSLNKSNRDMHRELKSLKEDFLQFRTEVDNIVGEVSTMKHHMGDAKSKSIMISKRIDYMEQDLELTKENVVNFQEEVEHVMELQQHQTQELANGLRLVQDQIVNVQDTFSSSITALDERQSHLEIKMSSLIDDYKLLLDDAQSTIHLLSESRLEEVSPIRCEDALFEIERSREVEKTPKRVQSTSSTTTPSQIQNTPLSRLGLGRRFTSPLDGFKNLVATKGLGEVTHISTDVCEEVAPVGVLHSYTVL